ncbi:MAG: hypothetical protein II948_11080 [Synergistaceae bacterium]|nr:hypothetical protein [Synergistaceae bacterium]
MAEVPVTYSPISLTKSSASLSAILILLAMFTSNSVRVMAVGLALMLEVSDIVASIAAFRLSSVLFVPVLDLRYILKSDELLKPFVPLDAVVRVRSMPIL